MKRALIAVALVCGCGDNDELIATEVTCEGMCLRDPDIRCFEDQCDLDKDCPRGTFCSSSGVCRAVKSRTNALDLLQKSFKVSSMQLTVDEIDGRSIVRWQVPTPTARIVNCTVWSCLPQVSSIKPISISNYQKCALFETGPLMAREGSFDLGSMRQRIPNRERDPRCERPDLFGETHTQATDLLTSCMVWDDTRLIAVSNLEPIRPGTVTTRIINSGDFVSAAIEIPSDDRCEMDWDPCYVETETTRMFGTCFEGTCRTRCVDDEDCVEQSASGSSSRSASRSCLRNEDRLQSVGACTDNWTLVPKSND